MLRRTLLLFVGLALLVLAAIVGFAALGLAGPEQTLARAETAFAESRYQDCVRLLDLAEESLAPGDPALLPRILRLRYRAHLGVGNQRQALHDIGRLHHLEPDDEGLLFELVWLQIRDEDGEAAIATLRPRLAAHPDDGRALELLGQAHQAIYQRELAAVRRDLAARLAPEQLDAAIDALSAWLYRPDADPGADRAWDRWARIVDEERRRDPLFADHTAELELIRRHVAESQQAFWRTLEVAGSPGAAYRGVAFALGESGRGDDLTALAECYLLRFDHAFTVHAARDLAELHLAAGRYEAAAEVALRTLDLPNLAERIATNRVNRNIRHVFLAGATALAALAGDDPARADDLAALARGAQEVQAAGVIDLEPEFHLVQALAAWTEGDFAQGARYARALREALQPTGRANPALEATALRQQIAHERRAGLPATARQEAIGRLAYLADDDADVAVAHAEVLLELGRTHPALQAAQRARALDAEHEGALRVMARAADAYHGATGRGSERALARCLQLGELLPRDLPDDHLLLTVAARALQQGAPRVARACANRAAELYGWARWPRELQIRAALDLGEPAAALPIVATLRRYHPDAEDVLALTRRVREAAGVPTGDLLFEELSAGLSGPGVARDLLRHAVDRRDIGLARHLAVSLERLAPDDPRALYAAAGVRIAEGRIDQAAKTLARVAELAQASDPELAADAFSRFFVFRAMVAEEPEVTALFQQVLRLREDDTGGLFELAEALLQLDRPRLAYQMLLPVLTSDAHRERRTGRHFALGARIALALDMQAEAERHLLAAISFDDGAEANRTLALLWLLQGREQEAAEAYWERTADDLTAAALSARFDRPELARGWIARELAARPLDVPALCLRVLVDPAAEHPPEIVDLFGDAAAAVADLLPILTAEGFERQADERCQALLALSPDNLVARFLYARHLAALGDADGALRELDAIITRDRQRRTENPALPPFVAAYDEAIGVLQRSGRPLTGPLAATLAEPFGWGVRTPRISALAARDTATRAAAMLGRNPEAMQQVIGALARVWIESPEGSGAGLAEVTLLAQTGNHAAAMELLDALEHSLPAERRPEFLRSYFFHAAVAAEASVPQVGESAEAKARALLDSEQAPGAAVHFIVLRDDTAHGPIDLASAPAERVRQRRELLERHWARFLDGTPCEADHLLATVHRFAELDGPAAGAHRATVALRRDPGLVDLWLHRARWLHEAGEVDAAVRSMRWTRALLPGHHVALTALELGARAGHADPRDVAALAAFEPPLLDRPEGRLTRGLVAFRRGRYAEAAALLGEVPAGGDGTAAYFRAIAATVLGDRARAIAAFRALADGGAATFALHAARFAAQLEAR